MRCVMVMVSVVVVVVVVGVGVLMWLELCDVVVGVVIT